MAMYMSHVVSSAITSVRTTSITNTTAAARGSHRTPAAANTVQVRVGGGVRGSSSSSLLIRRNNNNSSNSSNRRRRAASSLVTMAAAGEEPAGEKKKLWGGRFSEDIDPLMEKFNESLSFDRRMAQEDIRGSKGYARALAKTGIITDEERDQLVEGLTKVAAEWADDAFVVCDGDEDIHTANERRLGEIIGTVAGKLHTGRSRNDQVATDTRMWLRSQLVTLRGGATPFPFPIHTHTPHTPRTHPTHVMSWRQRPNRPRPRLALVCSPHVNANANANAGHGDDPCREGTSASSSPSPWSAPRRKSTSSCRASPTCSRRKP